jgi:hypothetical protein
LFTDSRAEGHGRQDEPDRVKKLPSVAELHPLEITAQREDVDWQSATTTDPYSLSPVSTIDVLVGHPAKQEDEKHGHLA